MCHNDAEWDSVRPWNDQDKASRSTALHAAAKAGNVATTEALLKSCLAKHPKTTG